MLLLDDFIKDLKRVNQFGDELVTNDEPTADLIRWINKYRRAVAKLTAWSWLMKSFTITVVEGTQLITIDATIKKLVAISDGRGGALKKITMQDAVKWHTPASGGTDNNCIGFFTDLGVDGTTGARIIKVYGMPGAAGTLTAYGTTTFTDFTLNSIGTSANFLPFSDEIMDMISELVSARVAKFKKDPDWAIQENIAWANLRIAMGEDQSDPIDDVTTPLPPYYRRVKAMRRGGSVV
jgi:hypothetical protein